MDRVDLPSAGELIAGTFTRLSGKSWWITRKQFRIIQAECWWCHPALTTATCVVGLAEIAGAPRAGPEWSVTRGHWPGTVAPSGGSGQASAAYYVLVAGRKAMLLTVSIGGT